MADIIYYATYLTTIGFTLMSYVFARSVIKRGGDTDVCSNRFAAVAIAAGGVSGMPVFYGALWLLGSIGHHINVGHGEALFAVPLLNFILGLVGAMTGRILLRWQSIKW